MVRMCRHCPEPVFLKGLCNRHFNMETYSPLGPRRTARSKKKRKIKIDEIWSRISKAWLSEHPICAACEKEGRFTPAGIVDHILPRRYFPELTYDKNNIQSLCQTRPYSCHQRKTGYERRGIAIDFVRRKKISFVALMKSKK